MFADKLSSAVQYMRLDHKKVKMVGWRILSNQQWDSTVCGLFTLELSTDRLNKNSLPIAVPKEEP